MIAAFLVAGGGGALLVLLLASWAWRRGRDEARLQVALENLDVRKRQLDAANRRPRDGRELSRRLRSGDF